MQYNPHDHFEWDEAKGLQNIEKHGFGFVEASLVFFGPIVAQRSTFRGEER